MFALLQTKKLQKTKQPKKPQTKQTKPTNNKQIPNKQNSKSCPPAQNPQKTQYQKNITKLEDQQTKKICKERLDKMLTDPQRQKNPLHFWAMKMRWTGNTVPKNIQNTPAK